MSFPSRRKSGLLPVRPSMFYIHFTINLCFSIFIIIYSYQIYFLYITMIQVILLDLTHLSLIQVLTPRVQDHGKSES